MPDWDGIRVEIIPATDTQGTRVAAAHAHEPWQRLVLAYRSEQSLGDNCLRAAQALACRLGWHGEPSGRVTLAWQRRECFLYVWAERA